MVFKCFLDCYIADTQHVSFHRIPNKATTKAKWIAFIMKEKHGPVLLKKGTLLCSKHFTPNCFKSTKKRRMLIDDSVPTISTQESVEVTKNEDQWKLPSTSGTSMGTSIRYEKQSSTSSIDTSATLTASSLNRTLTASSLSRTLTASSLSKTLTASDLSETITASEGSAAHYNQEAEEADNSQLEQQSNTRKRKRIAYMGDCSTENMSSPTKKKFRIAKKTVKKQRIKIRTLQKQTRRLKEKVKNLSTLMKELKEKLLLSEKAATNIMLSLDKNQQEMISRIFRGPIKKKYEPSIRQFALMLNFYSAKAYAYVRDQFNNSLPHPSTITKWLQNIDGSPGFTQQAANTLKCKVAEASKNNSQVLCNLTMDEMSIRRQVEWTGTKMSGLITMGIPEANNDELPAAREALVFMVVAVNSNWKLPVGYFLLDGLEASEKASLVINCLRFLDTTGVIITSLTFDGMSANISMCKQLGADLVKLENKFKHPNQDYDIFIVPDACHMIKLVRNCLAEKKIMIDREGKTINWQFFEKLVNFQEKEMLSAAPKLKKRHVQWFKEKMKVRLASQSFSKSVADALLFLEFDIELEEFQGAKATANFAQIFNDSFDIMNTRNYLCQGEFKRPLSKDTASYILNCIKKSKEYITGLHLDGIPILESRKKMGFLGFLIGFKSIEDIYHTYIINKRIISHLLTYKLSQDHLETFFSAIRSKGGFNNNPTARQFEGAYKRLLVHADLKNLSKGANCMTLDNTSILCISSSTITKTKEGIDLTETEFFNRTESDIDHDYCSSDMLTEYICDIVAYISGFVVKKLKVCITCNVCLAALESTETLSMLQSRKTLGGLVSASQFVINICTAAEKEFRFFERTKGLFNKSNMDIGYLLQIQTLRKLTDLKNEVLDRHIVDDPLNDHRTQVMKLILKHYFKIRIHHATKLHMQKNTQMRIRSICSKVIHFQNQ